LVTTRQDAAAQIAAYPKNLTAVIIFFIFAPVKTILLAG